MGQQCDIEAKLRNVCLLVPRLKSVKSDAKHLSEMINFTCTLAENVSAKVRELDVAKVLKVKGSIISIKTLLWFVNNREEFLNAKSE